METHEDRNWDSDTRRRTDLRRDEVSDILWQKRIHFRLQTTGRTFLPSDICRPWMASTDEWIAPKWHWPTGPSSPHHRTIISSQNHHLLITGPLSSHHSTIFSHQGTNISSKDHTPHHRTVFSSRDHHLVKGPHCLITGPYSLMTCSFSFLLLLQILPPL